MGGGEEEEEQRGPLAFLDDLLEEERNSSMFLGDVRFWKHLEHMDSSYIYQTKSLEYKTIKMMFCEALFFVIFLSALTNYIFSERAGDLYSSRRQQLDYWGGCIMQGDQRLCKIDNVKDIPSLMDWLRDDFSPLAFTDKDIYPSVVASTSVFRMQDGTMLWTPRYVGDTKTSILVGTIRMRQVRVQYNQDCTILDEFKEIVKDCFGDYSDGVQSRLSWAPAWTPSHLKEHYTWKESNITEQRRMQGKYGDYPGDGFVVDMALNLTGAQTRFTELNHWQWIDQRTRAFIIEFNTLNPNVNSFVHSRMLFEFPASGGVVVSQEAVAFRALQVSLSLMATDDFSGSFIYYVLCCGLNVAFAMYCGWLVYKNGFLQFFSYFWSTVDVAGMVVFFVTNIVKLIVVSEADALPNLAPEVIADSEMFYPVGMVVPKLELIVQLQALNGLLTWLRVLKYFTLSVTFLPFLRIFERCFTSMLIYGCLVIVVLYGFAISIYVSYGTEDGIFSSIWSIFVAVAVAPTGGVSFKTLLADEHDLFAPVVLFLYIVVVMLLVLTTFNAIQIDCYSVTMFSILDLRKSKARGTNMNPVLTFLWTYLNALKGVKLVGKENHDDMGHAEDQEISLNSLPEAIQIKYVKTKRKMLEIKDHAYGQIEEIRRQREAEIAGVSKKRSAAGAGWGSNLRGKLEATTVGAENENLALTEGVDAQPEEMEEPDDGDLPSSQEAANTMVQRVQLQRMLEDDTDLCEMCSTKKAVEVVRRFRVEQLGTDAYEAIAELQANVARKLDELEQFGSKLSFDEVETLKVMSQELHTALTESQKEWRAELLSVLQMASLLSASLIELTKKLEKVQINHSELAMMASPLQMQS
eukprot:TRINITY_DN95141_c0_g1_i1.p1 TRINITY_DN95141_c0_g1~~TRINITY_DN95141_c0_g1_i1.p1  ORF type:complete len:861 (-),score=169.39 TRINITY_DN95141_c0_g1_i1:111-2693(-)